MSVNPRGATLGRAASCVQLRGEKGNRRNAELHLRERRNVLEQASLGACPYNSRRNQETRQPCSPAPSLRLWRGGFSLPVRVPRAQAGRAGTRGAGPRASGRAPRRSPTGAEVCPALCWGTDGVSLPPCPVACPRLDTPAVAPFGGVGPAGEVAGQGGAGTCLPSPLC